MKFEIIDHQEEQSFPELHEGVCQEVVKSGHGASKDLGSACSRDGSHGEVQIEKTDGSSSGREEYDFPVLVRGSMASK